MSDEIQIVKMEVPEGQAGRIAGALAKALGEGYAYAADENGVDFVIRNSEGRITHLIEAKPDYDGTQYAIQAAREALNGVRQRNERAGERIERLQRRLERV